MTNYEIAKQMAQEKTQEVGFNVSFRELVTDFNEFETQKRFYELGGRCVNCKNKEISTPTMKFFDCRADKFLCYACQKKEF